MPLECHVVAHSSPDFAHCAAIRMEVFVDEQQVPPDEEMDELDASAVHVLALRDGQPVGTGRLVELPDQTARVGRMAVRREVRGTGVGSAILAALLEVARLRGIQRLVLAGQVHAIPFYERHEFAAFGDQFFEAGIEHRMMERYLGADADRRVEQ
jgi:predicted GNAT family N-acyltransferase